MTTDVVAGNCRAAIWNGDFFRQCARRSQRGKQFCRQHCSKLRLDGILMRYREYAMVEAFTGSPDALAGASTLPGVEAE